ncbi:glycosyltransferase [Natronomonas sp. F2-12]|jgi:glycosyltransferase involved in cell wall biosynthesis|uniref:Glycosyltransferase n=1 Tax=Natronomonas aquatica TaxID=2841590 RepID=A0A9R1D5W7_9EURY|nr:glycosyltransferase [Natronomonas aquatica]MCQ4332332.1 glycosyltransferase [Natronomonas aquatica]
MMIAAFMPVLNEAERIGRAISSLQRQTHPISKLVVVDGGSTDTTHEEVEAIATETDFEIDLHVIEGAGVRYSSQFGAEKAAEHLSEEGNGNDGVVLRLEGDSALEETFVERAVSRLEDESHTVFGGPVKPHDPAEKPFLKRVFTLVQNAEELPKGRGMAFRASDFYAVEGYRMESEEDIQASEIDCLEDGILVSKLQERGGVAFCHDTCVYSTVPSTSATSPRRWWIAAKIEREMGPTSYFTRIASPVNKLFYLGERFVEAVHSRRQVP